MVGEPPPSPMPDSSFPLVLSPLSPHQQGGPPVSVVAGSSTVVPRSGAAVAGSGATGSALGSAVGNVFTFTTPIAFSSFPAAMPLGSVPCGLDAVAGAPFSLSLTARPLMG
ncbi:hypothetical protein GUJ93_ZPchr0010g7790 [Zizania palustris]|uniref:Uncharacterized protein n=1 Tax=Zizania palustris TaxID=103762 RepID=A0A8J5WGW1_ZIZPA|nr:hypothetical protein GUJ93_ZPchr0010g7790 [Zizania palustris]